MAAPEKAEEILDVNRRYHDVAADEYDGKWGISFGEIGRQQVLGKVRKLLGAQPGHKILEAGAATGRNTSPDCSPDGCVLTITSSQLPL